jgi:uncharacterized membrane protein
MPIALRNILILALAIGLFGMLFVISTMMLAGLAVLIVAIILWRKMKRFFDSSSSSSSSEVRYEDVTDVEFEILDHDSERDDKHLK